MLNQKDIIRYNLSEVSLLPSAPAWIQKKGQLVLHLTDPTKGPATSTCITPSLRIPRNIETLIPFRKYWLLLGNIEYYLSRLFGKRWLLCSKTFRLVSEKAESLVMHL